MSPQQIVSAIFLAISLALLAVRPEPEAAAVVVSLACVFGFASWLERNQDRELEEFKAELKKLKDTVQALLVRAGLGR